jgi:hypothetical protein
MNDIRPGDQCHLTVKRCCDALAALTTFPSNKRRTTDAPMHGLLNKCSAVHAQQNVDQMFKEVVCCCVATSQQVVCSGLQLMYTTTGTAPMAVLPLSSTRNTSRKASPGAALHLLPVAVDEEGLRALDLHPRHPQHLHPPLRLLQAPPEHVLHRLAHLQAGPPLTSAQRAGPPLASAHTHSGVS